MNIVTIGFHTEGTTDDRFLRSIVKRTFDAVALECDPEIEVYDPVALSATAGAFTAVATLLSHQAFTEGLLVLCLHLDADAPTDREVFKRKITPALAALQAAQPPGSPSW